MSRTFHSSRPDAWTKPRQRDPREMTHGKIVPLQIEQPSFLSRLFRKA